MKLGTTVQALDEVAAAPPERPPEPIVERQVRAHSDGADVAVREALQLPMRLIASLPAVSTFRCWWRDLREGFFLTTSGEVRRACSAASLPCFAGQELAVVALAVEQGRAWPADLERWCHRKAADPGYQVTVAELFAGVHERIRPRGMALGEVLARLDAELLAVAVGADAGVRLAKGEPPS